MKLFAGGAIAAIIGLGWVLSLGNGNSSTAHAIYAAVPQHRSNVIEAFTVANRDCSRKLFGNLPAVIETVTGKMIVSTVDLPAARKGDIPEPADIIALKQQQAQQFEQRIKNAANSFTKEQVEAFNRMIKDPSSSDRYVQCVTQAAYDNLKAQGVIADPGT